jgi:hypothetical protein
MTTTREAMLPFLALVGAAPFKIAPERQQEMLDDVMGGVAWTIDLAGVESKMEAFPPDKHIDIAPSALAGLWALSYAAFHTQQAVAEIAATPEGQAAGVVDLGPLWAALRLRDMVEFARRLFKAEEDWPEGLALPVFGAPAGTDDDGVNTLFLGATAVILLHEIAHVHYDHSPWVGANISIGQEHQADAFAVAWPLKCATGAEREFRVLAICVALAWLLLFEKAKRGGVDHPAAIIRFREAAALFELGEDSPALERAVYALKAIFDPERSDMPVAMSAMEAFDDIDRRFEALFPRP